MQDLRGVEISIDRLIVYLDQIQNGVVLGTLIDPLLDLGPEEIPDVLRVLLRTSGVRRGPVLDLEL